MRTMRKPNAIRANVTACKPDYVGSCTIDKELMEKYDIRQFEKVCVDNVTKGKVHHETYAIEGKKGEICMNGAMAVSNDIGDIVDIFTEEICFEAR